MLLNRYVRGEACVSMGFSLQSAERPGGNVAQTAILGSAINQDGRSSSLTAPNGPSQQQVLYSFYYRFKGQYLGFKAYQNPETCSKPIQQPHGSQRTLPAAGVRSRVYLSFVRFKGESSGFMAHLHSEICRTAGWLVQHSHSSQRALPSNRYTAEGVFS